MLEFFVIFTEGGFILWNYKLTDAHIKILNLFLTKVFLEGHRSKSKFILDNLEYEWIWDNLRHLIFLASYSVRLKLLYISDLLQSVSVAFNQLYDACICPSNFVGLQVIRSPKFKENFGSTFDKILADIESKSQKSLNSSKLQTSSSIDNLSRNASSSSINNYADDEYPANVTDNMSGVTPLVSPTSSNVEKMNGVKMKNFPMKTAGKKSKEPTKTSTVPKKQTKLSRTWDGQISKEAAERLNFAEEESEEQSIRSLPYVDPESDNTNMAEWLQSQSSLDVGMMSDIGESDTSVDAALVSSDIYTKKVPQDSKILSFFKGLAGQKVLDHSNTQDVLKRMRDHLMSKNVAADIAEEICQSVQQSLIGHKAGTFQTITSLVRDATESAIRQVLTSSKQTDIFMEMAEAKILKRPYSIVFVGVNGVGKSTNLSKVCYWALKKNFKVLIVACDTFRSGAVEQLRTHVRALSSLGCGTVELFERGYGKDPAAIAKEGIAYATSKGFNCVLIDSAGRMQDNEPLMRALAKLVSENQPDKIIFVGEALVGNEAVDQLSKFNRALTDYAIHSSKIRNIDGIILSKLDTIDDKVGAALSMCYTSNAPILFVGTGQSYGDLKIMNVKSLVNLLLSP